MSTAKTIYLKPVYLMAICVFALAGMAIHQALRAPAIGAEEFGSGTAPMAVAIALICLTAIMVVREFTGTSPEAIEEVKEESVAVQTSAPLILKGTLLTVSLIAYVALLQITKIPFWILTLVFLAVGARIIEGQLRKWLLLSLTTSLVLGVSIEVVFTRLLLVGLP